MRRLLWVGDAACDSGFARCTHYTLATLKEHFDVSVLGLNYRGDPHQYPYPIYPAYQAGGDMFGVRRIREMLLTIKPDVVVIQNDPWNIPAYMNAVKGVKPRPVFVGAIAVDGKNCRGRAMNDLDHVIFWTEFAKQEALEGGLTKPAGVVGLGVDRRIYSPGDRAEARSKLGLPSEIMNGWWILNVNRNQPRKRLDLTIRYFAKWMHSRKAEDAVLYLHVAPTGDLGYDCDQLGGYYKLRGHLVLAEPPAFHGASEIEMVNTYRAANVQVSTTQGEGWGLTTLEGMACGLPQIVPDWSALGEWATAALRVRCSTTSVTPNRVNVIGGIPDEDEFIGALDTLYYNQAAVDRHREAGMALAARPEFDWRAIGIAFLAQVEEALARR